MRAIVFVCMSTLVKDFISRLNSYWFVFGSRKKGSNWKCLKDGLRKILLDVRKEEFNYRITEAVKRDIIFSWSCLTVGYVTKTKAIVADQSQQTQKTHQLENLYLARESLQLVSGARGLEKTPKRLAKRKRLMWLVTACRRIFFLLTSVEAERTKAFHVTY